MEQILSLILGIPLGVLTSLISWWILFHKIVPKIQFSKNISKTQSVDSKSGFRYRIKLENIGKRDILDVEIFARFKIKGVKPETPKNWSIIDLHISKNRIPIIKKNTNKMIRIYPEKTESFQKKFYPDLINKKQMNETLTMEDIFSIKEDTSLQIVLFGYDSFSGARKIFESSIYYKDNIKLGLFNKANLLIEEKSNNIKC